MKKIAILGSTGSIGKQTLEVVRHLKSFEVVALAANSNVEEIKKQIDEFHPKIVALYEEDSAKRLRNLCPNIEILSGMEGLIAVSTSNAEMIVSAMTGNIGVKPTLAAIRAKKDVALANKEVLVSLGSLVMAEVKRHGVRLLPIDSEHSAIFQALQGNHSSQISRLILTASGGPFLKKEENELKSVTLEEALRHPTWKMGPKVTIDSSTLMNKGLEVIEAHHLFDVPYSQIETVIHPQSVIHSMIEYIDRSIIAQMSAPTMVTPIQYALTYPNRAIGKPLPFDFLRHPRLEFSLPDFSKFRCLKLAFDAGVVGKSMPAFMNAANEQLVRRFVNREINWLSIGEKLEQLMQAHNAFPLSSEDELDDLEQLANRAASRA